MAKYLATKSRREIERLARERRIPTKRRKGRLLRVPRNWQKWELALIGTAPDNAVARKIGRSVVSVRKKRYSLGLPCVPLVKPWTPAEIALLGKLPDKEIARRVGKRYSTVQLKRTQLGITNAAGVIRFWTKAEDGLLGTASDTEIARKLKRSLASVFVRRRRLGVQPGNPTLSALDEAGRPDPWDDIRMRKWRDN